MELGNNETNQGEFILPTSYNLLQRCKNNDFAYLLQEVENAMEDSNLNASFQKSIQQQNARAVTKEIKDYLKGTLGKEAEEWFSEKTNEVNLNELIRKNNLIEDEAKIQLTKMLKQEKDLTAVISFILSTLNPVIFQEFLFLFEQIMARKYVSFQKTVDKSSFVPTFNCIWNQHQTPHLFIGDFLTHKDVDVLSITSFAHVYISDLSAFLFPLLPNFSFKRHQLKGRKALDNFTYFLRAFSEMIFMTIVGQTKQDNDGSNLNQSFEIEKDLEQEEMGLKRPYEKNQEMFETYDMSIKKRPKLA